MRTLLLAATQMGTPPHLHMLPSLFFQPHVKKVPRPFFELDFVAATALSLSHLNGSPDAKHTIIRLIWRKPIQRLLYRLRLFREKIILSKLKEKKRKERFPKCVVSAF